MPSVDRFEDLEVWQAARMLAREVYSLSNEGTFSRDFGLRDQIRRAAVSVSSNIAEGFERHSDTDENGHLCRYRSIHRLFGLNERTNYRERPCYTSGDG